MVSQPFVSMGMLWQQLGTKNKVVNVVSTLASPDDIATEQTPERQHLNTVHTSKMCAVVQMNIWGALMRDQLRGYYHICLEAMHFQWFTSMHT